MDHVGNVVFGPSTDPSRTREIVRKKIADLGEEKARAAAALRDLATVPTQALVDGEIGRLVQLARMVSREEGLRITSAQLDALKAIGRRLSGEQGS
jgi:hypothetical protein